MSEQISEKNRDYKYFIDDFTKLSMGARYTYRELLDEENLSFRFRTIIRSIMLQLVDEDTSLESHFYYMGTEGKDFACYRRLKAKVRYYCPEDKRGSLFGRKQEDAAAAGSGVATGDNGNIRYKEHFVKVQEFCAIPPEEKQKLGIVIHEIQLSKPALLTYVP